MLEHYNLIFLFLFSCIFLWAHFVFSSLTPYGKHSMTIKCCKKHFICMSSALPRESQRAESWRGDFWRASHNYIRYFLDSCKFHLLIQGSLHRASWIMIIIGPADMAYIYVSFLAPLSGPKNLPVSVQNLKYKVKKW